MNSQKKILLIVDDYLPYSTKVAAKMMHDLAGAFRQKGYFVTVLTPLPTLTVPYKREPLDNIDVIYFKSGQIKNVSKVKRAINEILLSFRAWRTCKRIFKKEHYDAIIYYSPSIFWGYLIGKLKKLWRVKTYLILRDIFPQWAVDNGLLKQNTLLHRFFKYFENINYKNANTIGVMSKANLQWFNKHFKTLDNVEVLPNWTKISAHKTQTNKYRQQFGLEDKVVFFYGGNIGHAQNMEVLINLAIRLKNNSKAHFLFVGKGDEVELILQKKKEYHLDNFTYLKPVEQQTYFEMLSEFDIGLFNLHPAHKTHNFPGKLLGYLEYAKPILGCVNIGNDLKEVVNNAKAGFILNAGEDEKLYHSAIQLLDSKELRIELGNNGLELLKREFDVNSIVDKLNTSLSEF